VRPWTSFVTGCEIGSTPSRSLVFGRDVGRGRPVQIRVSGSMAPCRGAALSLFATTSLGMFLATFARTMPQFVLLMITVLHPC
jgi:hypothetical protein